MSNDGIFEKIRERGRTQRSYWFDTSYPPGYVERYVSGKKSSDSWFRLQAFLASTDIEKIKALDPTYEEPINGEKS